MGVVHLARGPDGRRVALKVLRPHIVGDVEARERLAREVASLRRITSPRIAEILDADPHGPVPFVVTRYVPGLSLYHHVAEEGQITGADLLHFADALAESLQAVHAVGVLHRDVKPTNVLMEGRSPVLIDFGLARVAEDPRLTQTGWLLGTPGYLAPEILYGDDATTASDVHAWAATVVFAATGRPPYGKGPAMAIMDRVRRGEFDLTGVPEPLARLLGEALSPDPLERPTVHELRSRVGDLQQRAHHAASGEPGRQSQGQVGPEPWTMPFRPAASGFADPTSRTDRLPLDSGVGAAGSAPASLPATVPVPVPLPLPLPVAGQSEIPVREARPYQQPAPTTATLPAAVPQMLGPSAEPHPPWLAPTPRESSRSQRVLQLFGLGAVTTALVAYAPYAGTALVAILVLALRTASVTRQRHGRRRLMRGRARWYDVPTTTVSLPGYLLLAFFGTVTLLLSAAFVGVAMFSLAYLLGRPTSGGMVLAGVGFTPVLWWGPGSGRVREMTRGMVTRSARSEFGGWFVVVMCVLATAVLLGLLLSGGSDWAPAVSPPWT